VVGVNCKFKLRKEGVMKKIIFLILIIFLFYPIKTFSQIRVELFKRPLEINGIIRQEAAFNVNSGEWRNNSLYFTLQPEFLYHISDNVKLFGIFRLLADWAYNVNDHAGYWEHGLSYTDPFTGRRIRRSFLPSRDEMDVDDSTKYWIRELYADIFLENWDLRIGKQQIVWGETDGLRLADMLNPLDLRREFSLRAALEGYEDVRVTKWMVKAERYIRKEFLGARDMSLELVWNPGHIKVTEFNLGPEEGGVWGFPSPFSPPGLLINLNRKKPISDIHNSEYAFRFKFNWKEAFMTINGHYGFWHDAVVNYNGSWLIGGSYPNYFMLSPGVPGFPPGFLPRFIPIPFPSRTLPGFIPGVNFNALLDYDLEYYRRRMLGFTLTREISPIRLFGVAPVLRVEMTYDFKKPFNTIDATPFIGVNPFFKPRGGFIPPGSPTPYLSGLPPFGPVFIPGPSSIGRGIVFKEQLRLNIGIDWFIWVSKASVPGIPLLDRLLLPIRLINPNYPIYTSVQWTIERIPRYHEKLINAPFLGWPVRREQHYLALFFDTDYDKRRIHPVILNVWDLQNNAYFMCSKLEFKYGDHWRPTIRWHWYYGEKVKPQDPFSGSSFGLFTDRDQIIFELKYQW